jgi:ABC-type Na+ transport system ATPase subunit NatA
LLGKDGYDSALVSPDLPLRVNLTCLENVALIDQLHHHASWESASARAHQLLSCMGYKHIAEKRDEDITHSQRFAVKMARAIMLKRPLIVIDRPALLLPDVFYPEILRAMLACLLHETLEYVIIDYSWYAPLYETKP